jgi:hypothetical protein
MTRPLRPRCDRACCPELATSPRTLPPEKQQALAIALLDAQGADDLEDCA